MDLTHGEFVAHRLSPALSNLEAVQRNARSDIYALGGTLWFGAPRVWHHTLARPWTKFAIVKTRDGLPVAQLIARKVLNRW